MVNSSPDPVNAGTPDSFDVVIIGGGPAGSTLASFVLKYRPQSRILILEKEKFPRDHVGESQLPAIGAIRSPLPKPAGGTGMAAAARTG